MASNIDKALKKLDIPYGQFMFILCICENAGLSQEKLSCELQMDKGFVARTVKCLEEKGFVRRSPSPDDRRQNQLFPTEKAERAYPEIIETLREQEQKVIGDLSESEAYLLRVLLGKILKNL
jgi:DNA-binding MarR family transcriptional regulator